MFMIPSKIKTPDLVIFFNLWISSPIEGEIFVKFSTLSILVSVGIREEAYTSFNFKIIFKIKNFMKNFF